MILQVGKYKANSDSMCSDMADIIWWDRQTWQGKLPLTCSLQVCRVIHAQNKLWWFSYNQRSNFQNHKLTRKQSYTFARNNFPVVSVISQCLPWCFLSQLSQSSLYQSKILYILPQEICFYNKCSHLWECGTNYIFHPVPQLFPTIYHQIYWEMFIPKKQRNFKIAKWN